MANFQQVRLNDIEQVSNSVLKNSKLEDIESAGLENTINNCTDPNAVILQGSIPYTIINGNHRIHLARKKGWSSIRAILN